MTINDANNRISNLFEKACLALLSLFVTIMFITYQGMKSDYKEMQASITQLQMIKVNKEDLREVEVRLNTKIESLGATLSANSMANKADILGRMDLYFGSLKNRK
jgi:hypothetical protein